MICFLFKPDFTSCPPDPLRRMESHGWCEVAEISKIPTNTKCLIVKSQHRLNTDNFNPQLLPNLQLVVTATTGFDHLDIPFLLQNGIQVAHCPESHVESTAQLAFFLLLSGLRSLRTGPVSDQIWRPPIRPRHLSKGTTVGIYGLGRIGSRVSKILTSFGAQVLYFDPFVESQDLALRRVGSLPELVKAVDVLSVHVPLTQKTKLSLNFEVLSETKKNFVLVNAARGEIVDIHALLELKKRGQSIFYCTDVLETEPPNPTTSRTFSQIDHLWTPHIGAYTQEAFQDSVAEAVGVVAEFFSGQTGPQLESFSKRKLPDSLIYRADLTL